MKFRSTALVKGFRQSAPYLNAHIGKTIVIMVGGEAIAHENFSHIVNDIALLNSLGLRIVMVYGARPQISTLAEQMNYTTPYHKGVRVTDERALEIAKQAAGHLQLDITARFSMGLNNTPMAGSQINIVSGNFVIAQPLALMTVWTMPTAAGSAALIPKLSTASSISAPSSYSALSPAQLPVSVSTSPRKKLPPSWP